MSEHTPGPWILGTDRRYPSEPCIDAIMDGVVWHVALCHLGIGPEDSSAEANARLIAAAPELYDCLKDALPVLRTEYERQAAQHSEISSEKVSAFRKAQSRYETALRLIERVEGERSISTRRQGARLRG
jgi:hypothetical protein